MWPIQPHTTVLKMNITKEWCISYEVNKKQILVNLNCSHKVLALLVAADSITTVFRLAFKNSCSCNLWNAYLPTSYKKYDHVANHMYSSQNCFYVIYFFYFK